MRKGPKFLVIFRVFQGFHPRRSGKRFKKKKPCWSIHGTCWHSGAAISQGRSTLVAHQFSRSGPDGCSIRTNRFSWYWNRKASLKTSCGFFFELVIQSLLLIWSAE